MVCSTLARLDLIRVPLPAARTAANIGISSWWNMVTNDSYPRYAIDTREPLLGIHRLGRQDSNLRSRDQNPVPCHLATPQSADAYRKTARISRDYTGASIDYQ